MNSHERRDKARIYADILDNIHYLYSSGKRPTITGIQTKVNVPFVRFKEYVEDLEKKGLLKRIESEISLTEKGVQYLKEYRKVREFLEKFGMTEKEDKDQTN